MAGHRHAIKTIRRYAQLVAAGWGNEHLMEAHHTEMVARLTEFQENLELIGHKIDVYRGRLAVGDADQLWAPRRARPGPWPLAG